MLFGAHVPIAVDAVVDGEHLQVSMECPDGPEACLWALSDQWTFLFPGALPEVQRRWWTSRMRDPSDALSLVHLRPIAFNLALQVYGVPWWSAHRILTETAQQRMGFEVWCVGHAFDPAGEPPHRIVAAAVAYLSSQLQTDEERQAWQARITMRPKGVAA